MIKGATFWTHTLFNVFVFEFTKKSVNLLWIKEWNLYTYYVVYWKVNPEEFNIIFPTLQQWKENYNE